MTITTTKLTRAAGLFAVAAGLLFIAVQIKHLHGPFRRVTGPDADSSPSGPLDRAAEQQVTSVGARAVRERASGHLARVDPASAELGERDLAVKRPLPAGPRRRGLRDIEHPDRRR